jgi:NAD(P)H dehydrogenase (quinone)
MGVLFMKILVTGATGHFGAKVMDTLLTTVPAENLAVSVRDTEKAKALQERGVEVRQGDFNEPSTLEKAFEGVDRLLIISTQDNNETRIKQHVAAVEAAKKANVRFIAYTSLANIDKSELSLAVVHRETEAAIRNTGIPYAFLRNNWYIENEAPSFQGVLMGAPLAISAGDGRVGWATRDDYAEAAAKVLAGDRYENSVYELCGTPISYDELAAILGKVIGREVPVEKVDDSTYASIMEGAGLPKDLVAFLVDIQSSIRKGSLDSESDDFEKLLGRKPTPLSDVIGRIVAGFKA